MNLWRRLRGRALVRPGDPPWRRQWLTEGYRQLNADEAAMIPFPEGRRGDRFRWAYDGTVWEWRR